MLSIEPPGPISENQKVLKKNVTLRPTTLKGAAIGPNGRRASTVQALVEQDIGHTVDTREQ